MIRDRHYSPEYAVSRTLRRYAKVFQEVAEQLPGRARHRHFRHRKAAAAQSARPAPRRAVSALPRRSSCWPTTSRPAKPPTSTASWSAALSPRSAAPAATPRSWPKRMEIPAVVGIGPFLTDVSGGDLVIIDGDNGLVILQPDEETIARYRHEAEQQRTAAARLVELPRSAGRNRLRHAHRSCSATSSSPTRSITASSAAPTASGCTARSFCTSLRSASRPKRTTSRRTRASCRRWATSRS